MTSAKSDYILTNVKFFTLASMDVCAFFVNNC